MPFLSCRPHHLRFIAERSAILYRMGVGAASRRAGLVQPQVRYQSSEKKRPVVLGRPPTHASIVNSSKIFLAERLGLSRERLKKIESSNKGILTLGKGVLEERIDWLKERLHLKDATEVCKMVHAQPTILGHRSEILDTKISFLQTRLGLSDPQLRKIVLGAPNAVAFDADNIKQKIEFLKERLVLDEDSLRRVILQSPSSILTRSSTNNIGPKLDFLQKRLCLETADLRKIVTRFPNILEYSQSENYAPKIAFFRRRFNIGDAALGRMIRTKPQIVGLSIPDSLEPTLSWVRQRLSVTDEELSKFVPANPAFFGMSIEQNLEPTRRFYIDALGDEEEAVALLKRRPVLFFYSLDKRLKPRLKEARALGLTIDTVLLKQIGELTEKQWHSSIEYHVRKQSRQKARMGT